MLSEQKPRRALGLDRFRQLSMDSPARERRFIVNGHGQGPANALLAFPMGRTLIVFPRNAIPIRPRDRELGRGAQRAVGGRFDAIDLGADVDAIPILLL
jgi:hypothetical protein